MKQIKQNGHFSVMNEKLKESLVSVMPIVVIVLVLCFIFTPVESSFMLAFLIGTVLIIVGMGTDAGTVVMSLPVSAVAGFGMLDNK